jgi:hypothetical protein
MWLNTACPGFNTDQDSSSVVPRVPHPLFPCPVYQQQQNESDAKITLQQLMRIAQSTNSTQQLGK